MNLTKLSYGGQILEPTRNNMKRVLNMALLSSEKKHIEPKFPDVNLNEFLGDMFEKNRKIEIDNEIKKCLSRFVDLPNHFHI